MKNRKWWMRIVRGTGRFIESFVAFLFFYLTISIYGAVIPVGELKTDGDVCIYVQSNGVHTDVCLPVENKQVNWLNFIPRDAFPEDANFDYVTIGWGDKGFFLDTPTWAELKVSTALNAAFLPSPTAMHVEYTEKPAEDEMHRPVYLSRADYARLIKFVKKSFTLVGKEIDLIPDSGYSEYDNFYEANDAYHLFRTCNRWTNEALKSANVKTGVFALFPDGILSHLR